MIDHVAARRLSATAIDFELDTTERDERDAHLRECLDCRTTSSVYRIDAGRLRELDYGTVPAAVRARVAITAERGDRSASRGWVLLAAAALLLLAVVGGLAGGVGRGDGGEVVDRVGRAIDWSTEVVALEAADFYLEANGRVWVPPEDAAVSVSSDPGTWGGYWTLEITWMDGPVEQRMNLYFASDGATWQISEARIYNGRVPGEWLTQMGPLVSTLLGQAYVGDLTIDLVDTQGTGAGPGRIVLRDARLAVAPRGGFAPAPGAVGPNAPVPVPVDPASAATIDCGPADKATCSDIVAKAMVEFGDRGITLIRVTASDGSHEVHLADGSVVATIGQ